MQKERREHKRFILIEDLTKIIKDLKNGEVVIDLSLTGAKIISLDPKKIGDSIIFSIDLPDNLGKLEINGESIRSKPIKTFKPTLFETGIRFHELSKVDTVTLQSYISYLERNEILVEGKAKLKELLSATKKLKRNLLVLKCSMAPKEEKDTTQ